MSLIGYAGKEPATQAPNRKARALTMFNEGRNTLQIASSMGVSEAEAHRWVNVERSAEFGLPAPYRSEAS